MVEKNNKTFYLYGGKKFSSLKAFAKELKEMSDEAFFHHVNETKNDFANWLKHSLKEAKLAERIEKCLSKIELELEVLRHIVHNKADELRKKESRKKKITTKSKNSKKSNSRSGTKAKKTNKNTSKKN